MSGQFIFNSIQVNIVYKCSTYARTLLYKENLILMSLYDSFFYSLTFQIHIHIHIFISEATCYFCNFCYRLTILLLFPLKLRPDVAPTAWRRNLFCVPTQPSLHRHAFPSPSYRFLIPSYRIFILLVTHFHPLVSLSHSPRVTFPSYIFVTFSASSFWIVKIIALCATTV